MPLNLPGVRLHDPTLAEIIEAATVEQARHPGERIAIFMAMQKLARLRVTEEYEAAPASVLDARFDIYAHDALELSVVVGPMPRLGRVGGPAL